MFPNISRNRDWFGTFILLHGEKEDCRRGRRHHHGPGERQRRGRGDIKYLLLGLIMEGPKHGYQLIKELEVRAGGFTRLSPGSVYPTLQLLEEGEYIVSEQVEGKKVYTITEAGRELLETHRALGNNQTESEEQPQLMELQSTVRDINELVLQVARSGKRELVAKLQAQLKQLKREIYLMLAEED